ncbi:hypothetical protein [Escherichia coli]
MSAIIVMAVLYLENHS